MTETTKVKRQTDPDVARIRAVKQAALKRDAALVASARAAQRLSAARDALHHLIEDAPEAQQAYLRSLAEPPA